MNTSYVIFYTSVALGAVSGVSHTAMANIQNTPEYIAYDAEEDAASDVTLADDDGCTDDASSLGNSEDDPDVVNYVPASVYPE